MPRNLLAPLLLCCAFAHAAPATDWRAAAQQDMQFAIEKIRSNHAGSVAGQVDVNRALEHGGRVGLLEAAHVETALDYRRALVRFISGFGDPHTGIDVGLKIAAWTGIVLDHADGHYRVLWSEPGWPHALPPRGATVQQCDGVWIGTYLKTSVAPFINYSLEYAPTLGEAARQSMFDFGLGWAPQGCDFTLADGSTRHYDLPLRNVADGIGEARITQVRQQYRAAARPVGLTPLAPGMAWIGMPDFNGGTSAAAYNQLYPQLAAARSAKWVVFDLRGNGGGDSSWGNRALQALYGQEYGASLGETSSYGKRLIADQATVDVYRRYASLPEYAASKGEYDALLEKLEGAIKRGDKLVEVDGRTRAQWAALVAQLRQRPGGPRVAAVIDRRCFSSCMNFVQQISTMADTVVLGEPTIGYSPYGEIEVFKLPSGNGSIRLPSAIYTTAQAPREPFVPDLPYAGNLADDAALMKWVAARLAVLKPGRKQ